MIYKIIPIMTLLLSSCATVSNPNIENNLFDDQEQGDLDSSTELQNGDSDSNTDQQNGTTLDWPQSKYISPADVYQHLTANDTDMLPLNVVDEEFYSLGNIEGSLVIPWDLLNHNLNQVDPQKHVVVYCRKGVRSESGYATLKNANYTMVWVMEGGLEEWIRLGYPVVH